MRFAMVRVSGRGPFALAYLQRRGRTSAILLRSTGASQRSPTSDSAAASYDLRHKASSPRALQRRPRALLAVLGSGFRAHRLRATPALHSAVAEEERGGHDDDDDDDRRDCAGGESAFGI